MDFSKVFDSSDILLNSSLWVFRSALLNGYDLISQIAVQKPLSVISIVVLFIFEEVFLKVQFLDQFFSFYLLTIFLPFFLHLLRPPSMQMTLPFGPFLQMLIVQLPLSKLPSTDWWNGPPHGMYLSTLSSVSYPS